MIGLIVIGRHERLREAYKQVGSARGIVPSRLSEIDYVHPSDFAKVLSALPETLIRWTNNLNAKTLLAKTSFRETLKHLNTQTPAIPGAHPTLPPEFPRRHRAKSQRWFPVCGRFR